MLKIMKSVAVLTALLLLGGCTPTYHSGSGTPTTKLNTTNLNISMICVDGKRYMLRSSNGYAAIPVGKRITLIDSLTMQGYNITYSCEPKISFVPSEDVTYYAHVDLVDEACRISVFQEGGNNRIGLSLDHTLGRSNCTEN